MEMANEKRYAANVKYRRGGSEAEELAMYVAAMTDRQQEQVMTKVQRVILRAMQKLVTQRQVECLELYYLRGCTYEQISRRLQVSSPSTAGTNILRGREKMRRVLSFAQELLEASRDDKA